MFEDPPVASKILRAFERAATEADPVFPFADGFALVHRHFGEGVLTPETRREITDALWEAERAVEPHLPEHFGEPDRLRMGTETLGGLMTLWTEPAASEARSSNDVRLQRYIVRVLTNDLDTICARLEVERSGLLPSKQHVPGPASSHGVVH